MCYTAGLYAIWKIVKNILQNGPIQADVQQRFDLKLPFLGIYQTDPLNF